MKFARNTLVLLALGATVAACDDDPTDVEVDLSGDYTVQTFLYEADDDDTSFDLALVPQSQGGPLGITEMTVEEDHSFSGTLRLPVDGEIRTFPAGGDIEITGDNTLRIDFNATTDALGILDDFEDGTFELSGNTLTIVLPDVTFDFTLQGGEGVAADLTIVGTRS